jgi:hypothetical protein
MRLKIHELAYLLASLAKGMALTLCGKQWTLAGSKEHCLTDA